MAEEAARKQPAEKPFNRPHQRPIVGISCLRSLLSWQAVGGAEYMSAAGTPPKVEMVCRVVVKVEPVVQAELGASPRAEVPVPAALEERELPPVA